MLFRSPLELTGLEISPVLFGAAKRGAALTRTGRTGASLRFRLSRAAKVDFRLSRAARVRFRVARPRRPGRPVARTPLVHREIGRFSARGRRGINRFRFTGRLRGRALAAGSYRLTAHGIDRDGVASAPASVGFRIR